MRQPYSVQQLRDEIQARRLKLERNETLAITGPPRSRFAYAAAATKQRSKLARLERELAEYGDSL
jgi:hypothetical protein